MFCQQRVFSSPVEQQRLSGNKRRFRVSECDFLNHDSVNLQRKWCSASSLVLMTSAYMCLFTCMCVWVKAMANCHLCSSCLSHSRDGSAQQLPLASPDARSSSGSFRFPASTQVIGRIVWSQSVTMWCETVIRERSDETCQLSLGRSSSLSHESSERRS